MTEVISILEHQSVPIVEQRQNGDIALSHRHAQLLSQMTTLPLRAFTWGHNSIKWSQFCGLVLLGDLTLEILPKIHGKESNVGSCRDALIRMLKRAGLIKLHKPGGATVNVQKHTLLDVFIIDLCQQISAQLLQGKLRQYITQEENLPVLRGKLLSGMQLRHNLAHKERLYCQYDELSEDVFVNQVIKYTLRLLHPKARAQSVKKALARLLFVFDGISDNPIDLQRLLSLSLNRSESRYQSIVDICSLFVQSLAPDFNAGQQQSFSMMFDMNQLFESWVASILRPVAHKHGLRLREQGPRRYFAYRSDLQRDVFQMKPDISFVNASGIPVLIADAKWKLLEVSEAKLGVSQADLYQMQAYGNRYNTTQLCLIYPGQAGLKSSYDLELHGQHGAKLQITTLEISADHSDELQLNLG